VGEESGKVAEKPQTGWGGGGAEHPLLEIDVGRREHPLLETGVGDGRYDGEKLLEVGEGARVGVVSEWGGVGGVSVVQVVADGGVAW
jgi:hypothetical protein